MDESESHPSSGLRRCAEETWDFSVYELEIPVSDERKRTAYQTKISEYIDRAEAIRNLIEQEKGKVQRGRETPAYRSSLDGRCGSTH